MIDIEVDVYDGLYSLLAKECPGVFLSGELVRAPSSFPSVTMMEADNYVATDTQDSGSNENHVKVMYEVAVYSNRATDRKSECRSILAVVDRYFIGLGFTRTSTNTIPDGEGKYLRVVSRYTAKVSANHTIYTR